MEPAKLSRALLDLRFMKRTKERVQKEEEDAEGQAMYSNEITEKMKKSGNIIFTETSIFNCYGLIEGRMSFGGMNPEIEKLMQDETGKKLEELEKRREVEISDVEMAQVQSNTTLNNTICNKFNPKKNRNKKKFMRPAEDD